MTILDSLFKQSGTTDPALAELLADPGVRMEQVDLTKPLTVAPDPGPFDVVYHLAAINGTRLFYEMPYQVASGNLAMTLSLLAWLRGRSVGMLVYASTSEVYAGAVALGLARVPTAEEALVAFPQPTAVRFSYATSKFMGEFLVREFGVETGMPTCIVRYHNVYGPRMGSKHVVSELIVRIAQGERPLRVYGADETRAFCYVDDAVEATVRLGGTPSAAGEIVHIGNAKEEIAIGDLARMLLEQMGAPAEFVAEPGRGASVSRRCPDTGKLSRLTGFEAGVALRQGLARTIPWYTR